MDISFLARELFRASIFRTPVVVLPLVPAPSSVHVHRIGRLRVTRLGLHCQHEGNFFTSRAGRRHGPGMHEGNFFTSRAGRRHGPGMTKQQIAKHNPE